MDAGKVKVVLNALRDELHTRRTTPAHGSAGAADDGAVLPAYGSDGLGHDSNRGGNDNRKYRQPAQSGVLVDLSSDALASSKAPQLPRAASPTEDTDTIGAAELSQRPIPELVVPFFVPQEPFVVVGPYLVRAVLAAAAAGMLMLFVL